MLHRSQYLIPKLNRFRSYQVAYLDSLIRPNIPIADDGACIFTGKTAIYSGNESVFDDRAGHILPRGLPAAVCDKTAAKLLALLPEECLITPSTWHYQSDGCC